MIELREPITRALYEKMLRDAFDTIANHEECSSEHKGTNIVNNVLIDLEIAIPSQPNQFDMEGLLALLRDHIDDDSIVIVEDLAEEILGIIWCGKPRG